jgi:hypothetical protein
VVLAPFVALGGVPGMEMPHTAAAVMLGGLVTTTLVNLFVLPVAGQVFGARLAAGSPVVVSAADAAHPPAAHPPAAHPPAAQPAHAGAGGQSAVVRAQAGDRGAGFRENA